MIIALLGGMSLFSVYCLVVDLVDKHLAYGAAKNFLARIAAATLVLIVVAEVFSNFGLLGFFIAAIADVILVACRQSKTADRHDGES